MLLRSAGWMRWNCKLISPRFDKIPTITTHTWMIKNGKEESISLVTSS